MTWDWLGDVLVRLPGVVLGIGLHEWAHAFVADRSGDPTPREDGRVTLDLATHLDPLGTLFIFFGPIGWGRAVLINPSNFDYPERDYMRVALAGPLTNVFLAAASILVLGLLNSYSEVILSQKTAQTLWEITAWCALLNVLLAAFNLIPIPPLDGSKVAWYYLNEDGRSLLDHLRPLGMVLILKIGFFGGFEPIYAFGLTAAGAIAERGLAFQALVVLLAAGAWAQNAELLWGPDRNRPGIGPGLIRD